MARKIDLESTLNHTQETYAGSLVWQHTNL